MNCSNAQASGGIVASVTWNGQNICSASGASSALSVDFTKSAHVVYTWNSTGNGPVALTDARLAMNYFGFALATRDVGPVSPSVATNGSFVMDWDPGALTYVLEGLYGLTATVFASNGSSVWSESFFVKATAPYTILAALPILLIVIAVFELYAVARSGRQSAIAPKKGTPPPPPPTSDSGADSASEGTR